MTTRTLNPVGYCIDCDQAMYSRAAPAGYLRHNGHGYCSTCAKRRRRAEIAATAGNPPPVEPDNTWMADAACAQIGPADDYYYPAKGISPEPAKRICLTQCKVREQCLEYALTIERHSSDRFGIWGGLSPQERDKVARQRREQGAA